MSRAGVIASALLLAGCAAERRPACPATVVPAYLRPEEIVRLADRGPLPWLLVVNPASGPGSEPAADYRHAVGAAQAAGARVLGYVPTMWAARARAEVEADTDRYREWYGVDGVFLDEAADTAAALGHYRALADHARSAGARIVVLNPGVVPARGYFDVADIVVTFEGPFSEYRRSSHPSWVDPERSAQLVYGATRAQALEALAQPAPGRLYVTSGTLPHPWGVVPDYLERCP